PVFLAKWQRMLRQKHKTLASFEQARQAVALDKIQEIEQQARWITALLS
ncbi:MAG: tRNA (adenine-N(1))-methyltransferase, partial [Oxalobacteraceae bacterium]